MVSWLEELERRESAARERAEELWRRVGELSDQLAAEEQLLLRLQVTWEMMLEIVGAAADVAEPVAVVGAAGEGAEGGAEPVSVGGSPIGVMLVPPRSAGALVSGLPQDYRDILEVLADSERGLRTGHVAAALGLSEERSVVESLRSKLKRLVARGWLGEQMPGLFTLADGVDINT
ncbi:hypothetical protein [Nocardia terpenica]|uniref:Uncharacterized protein n=1 Tax=Nocardia terpenica TaxID=455432 RepID=A0A6G9ZDI4_9NOCA|nr:hypothetical protein [Nocardia terpenica]QIS23407.1 hypothetical protein F6W96_38845 [Nocardia terpenica]